MWISCDKCEKWNHPDCEIEYGKDEVYREAARELRRREIAEAEKMVAQESGAAEESKDPQPDLPDPKYYCVTCRKEQLNLAKQASKKSGKGKSASKGKNTVSKQQSMTSLGSKKQSGMSPEQR